MLRTYKYSIENFRGIAIIFVMLSHITSYSAVGSFELFVKFLLGDATTFFVFISGYLFANTEISKNFKYLIYLQKKTRFVIGPYLLLLLAPIMMGIYEKQFILVDLNILEYMVWSFFVGGAQVGPMWFVPLIILFFLCSFIFIGLRPGFFLGFITVFFLLISIYTSRPVLNINPFLSFIHFLGFYLLGISFFYLGNFFSRISFVNSFLLITACVIIFSLSFFCYQNKYWVTSSYQGFFDKVGMLNLLQLGKLVLLIGLFLFLEKFYNYKNKYLSYLAKISFGLFFIHGYYMVFYSRIILPKIENDGLRLIVELAIVIIFSLLTVYAIRKLIPNKSRYVIGC